MRRLVLTTVSATALVWAGAAAAQGPATQTDAEARYVVATIDAITVTATRNPIEVFSYPGAVTVLDQEAIDDLATSVLSDLFDAIPGVAFGGGPRRTGDVPSVRGVEGEGVLVLFDGIRQNFLSGHDGRFFIDPDLLKSVEIVRGPSSALYGSGALGGVIAFQTLDAADRLAEGETFGVQVKTGYQDVSEEYSAGASVFARSLDGRYDGVASITYRNSGDIALPGDLSLQSEDEILSGLLKGSARITDDLSLSASWISFTNDAVEPNNGQGLTEGDLVDKAIRSNTLRAGLTYTPDDNRWVDASLTGYGAVTGVEEAELESARVIEREVDSFGVIADNRSRLVYGEDLSVTLTYGAEYYRDEQTGTDTTTADGSRGGVPDATADTLGLFAQAEISANTPFGTITAIPGIRYDRFETERAEGDLATDDDAVSPKFGLSYQPQDWLLLFGNYAEAFRAPSFNEIYADDVHFRIPLGPGVNAPNSFVENTDLEPETSTSWEIGAGIDFADLLLTGDRLIAKGSYFLSDVDDLINLEVDQTFSPSCFNPMIPLPCTAGTSRFANVENAELDGIEIEAQYDSPLFYLTAAYSSIDGENQDTGGFVGVLTADRINLDTGIRLPAIDGRLGLRAEFAAEFDKADDPAAFRDGYQVYDLYFVWAPSLGPLEGLRVDLGADNLFDERYERVFAGVPEPGRNLKAIVRWDGAF